MNINPLDRFYVGGDYGTSVDLECQDCALFIVSFSYPATLAEIMQVVEKHIKENHSEV